MDDLMNYIFAFFGIGALLYIVYLDKVFSETPTTDRRVFGIIWGYIILAFVWPKQATKVVNHFIDKYLPKWQKERKE